MISQGIISGNNLTPRPVKRLDIEQIIDQRMPPAPGSLLRLMKILRDYKTPRSVLIEAINYDPILVARVLRLANSPIYSFEREIFLIDMALTAIGSQAIYDIVVIELAARAFNTKANQSEAFRKLWKHSIAVAVLTKTLSQTLDPRVFEESFICGMLHDFGKFILLNFDAAEYKKILTIDDEFEMLKAECAIFGYTHAEIGSLVARRWNLPEKICYSILHHHDPNRSEQPKTVENIINVADILANFNGYGTRTEIRSKLLSSDSAIKLGLTEQFLDNIWKTSKGNIADIIETFG